MLTIILRMVLVSCCEDVLVVHSIWRPRTQFIQSVPNLVVGVQTCCLHQYTSYDVGNVHDKLQGCTVDVQVATVF